MQFEKNSIVLIVGYYVYEEDTEYIHITLIQSGSISYSDDEYTLTSENLPNSSSLLFYSASVIMNSYIPNNKEGQESFMLARHLYNAVTNNKHVDSKVVVSYMNKNNHYNALKNNLKKIVLSVIELDIQLESIKERYAMLTSQSPQKKQKIGFQNSTLNKSLNNKTTSLSFIEAILQIQKKALSTKSLYIESTSQVILQIQKALSTEPSCIGSTSQITNTRPNPKTFILLTSYITENIMFTDTTEPVKLMHINKYFCSLKQKT
ncbi:2944_t:CDS:2 [Cetraspora pellucida]|uniref:2944_t:CDS:1 n=1 Tax=Cetraspora pellucida TaxID=1433469 RepID=A0ACA9K3P9_9GLOM|nr:2944_t:CDS:2 [Cetraspora pellucida]